MAPSKEREREKKTRCKVSLAITLCWLIFARSWNICFSSHDYVVILFGTKKSNSLRRQRFILHEGYHREKKKECSHLYQVESRQYSIQFPRLPKCHLEPCLSFAIYITAANSRSRKWAEITYSTSDVLITSVISMWKKSKRKRKDFEFMINWSSTVLSNLITAQTWSLTLKQCFLATRPRNFVSCWI